MRWLKDHYVSSYYTLLLFTISIYLCLATEVNNENAQSKPYMNQQQQQQHQHQQYQQQQQQYHQQHSPQYERQRSAGGGSVVGGPIAGGGIISSPTTHSIEPRSSYAMLSQAMSQAVHHEFSGSADGSCLADDLECITLHDQLGMEAIKSLHRQLDDDDNGDIDLSESDDFLREELKYDSGYEKRHKAFHFNDDMHISVKELWEAWLRSEVHNWTVDQTTEWLAQSVQLPQYVHLFKQHKVNGKVLPRLAVNNMHYVSTVLGIKDPIHKQKIALKAMDAVLFGPPRETGTRWKDLLLVTLLLTAIIGSWYAYQQNKNAKIHLRRMAKDVEGLLKAEVALKDMQMELERARLEQENVGKEKLDLERRLKEAPTLSSSNSDLELQQLKQEIEMLRSELSRAEVEINDHCWTPPQGLQNWLQLTYELENKHHSKKRVLAEKQLQQAREACEKLKKKRSSLVGAFVSTHGKSIDDVDRSIVEARNALNDVTNDLQERMHRWKQIESILGFNIVNNNGIAYLENILYSRNGSVKSRGRLTSSQDDLDDDSVQGLYEGLCRANRDDSSASDDGDRDNRDTVTFILGCSPVGSNSNMGSPIASVATLNHSSSVTSTTTSSPPSSHAATPTIQPPHQNHQLNTNDSSHSLFDDHSQISSSNERIVPAPRSKKAPVKLPQIVPSAGSKAPMPPPRKTMSSQSSDMVSLESPTLSLPSPTASITSATTLQHQQHQQLQHIIDNNIMQQQQLQLKQNQQQQQPRELQHSYHQQQPPMEDTYSTDSSSFDDDVKRRRRKLHFPFGKKFSKNKK